MPNVILPIYYNVLLKLLYIYSLQHQPLFVYVNKQNNQQLPCCLPFSILISALMTLNLIQSTEIKINIKSAFTKYNTAVLFVRIIKVRDILPLNQLNK